LRADTRTSRISMTSECAIDKLRCRRATISSTDP
jgi:hypothetical protein